MSKASGPSNAVRHGQGRLVRGGFLRGGWAGVVLACLVGVLLGASGWTFHTARGTSYFSSDPTACINCHLMREPFDSWQKSSHHAAATCVDCHLSQHPLGKWVTKADAGFRHSWAFTFQTFHEPLQLHPRSRQVLHDNCLRCHRELLGQQLACSAMAEDVGSCLRCHGDVGHAEHRARSYRLP
jgi:cytochrome c nitrite reductase small subunit